MYFLILVSTWYEWCNNHYLLCSVFVQVLEIQVGYHKSWRRHQMETFSTLLALCARNSQVTGEFSSQKPVTRSFDVVFDPRLNKRLSKQSRRRWFETPLRSLLRHCNVDFLSTTIIIHDRLQFVAFLSIWDAIILSNIKIYSYNRNTVGSNN